MAAIAIVLAACGPRTVADETPLPKASALPSGAAPANRIAVTATLARACLEPGAQIELTVRTVRGAALEIAAAFPGRQVSPLQARISGSQVKDGRYVWRARVPDGIRRGAAVVAILARFGERTGTYTVPFDVEESC